MVGARDSPEVSHRPANETSPGSRGFRCRCTGHTDGMTENPHTPKSQPADPEPSKNQPAITHRDRERPAALRPKDVAAGPEGEYPDPDEYAGTDDH